MGVSSCWLSRTSSAGKGCAGGANAGVAKVSGAAMVIDWVRWE